MHSNVLSLISLIIYLGLVLAPLGIAHSLSLPSRPFLDQLSSHLAIIGFNVILLEFLSTGRLKWISGLLGIDWVLQIHQLFARLSVLLLVIHPFIYTLPNRPSYAPGLPDERYLGLNSSSLITGLFALIILGLMIGLAINRNQSGQKYETWRASHAIMALMVALLGFHHTTHAGRFSQDSWVLTYWQLGLAIALLSILWVYLIQPLRQVRQSYRVTSIREVSARTWELVIDQSNPSHHSTGRLKYQAGQFAWLKLGKAYPLFENPFSIASCPEEDSSQLKFLIKDVGDFTHQVTELNIGDPIFVDGAYGNFGQSIFDPETKEVVLIAGGVGLAPLLSLIRALTHHSNTALLKKKFVLIIGNRIEEQIIDLNGMVKLNAFEDLTHVNVISEPTQQWLGEVGVLDAATLNRILKSTDIEITRAHYFVCGPAVMIDAVENALDNMGVPLSQIDSEKFQYDFSKKNPRNQRSIMTAVLCASALVGVATYWALR